ncbi:MAG: hypothetical protein MZV63_04740 [Marinilabiliales bacterium]|nr:hypothetical protein [Marinilabiliales bacterium]
MKPMVAAVESRTSSPVRVTRDPDNLNALSIQWIVSCRRGAGYAGGIVSSAVDGMRVAEKIVLKYGSVETRNLRVSTSVGQTPSRLLQQPCSR